MQMVFGRYDVCRQVSFQKLQNSLHKLQCRKICIQNWKADHYWNCAHLKWYAK
jgi:hypothetical protein